MTKEEFRNRYFVEPVFTDTKIVFNVYLGKKLDFVTPEIKISGSVTYEAFEDNFIKEEVEKFAYSLIYKRYDVR